MKLRRTKATQKPPTSVMMMPPPPMPISPMTITRIEHVTFFSYSQASGRLQTLGDRERFEASDENVTVIGIGETAVDVFLRSFREHGSEFVSSAYLLRHSINLSTVDGTLYSSLPEDVFTVIESQTSLLDDFLKSSNLSKTPIGDAIIVDALLSILRVMDCKQMHYRDSFLDDFESCIAASNDFLRMSEKTENMMQEVRERYSQLGWDASGSKTKLSEWDVTTRLLEQETSNLLDRFGQDAVLASQRAAIYVLESIEQSEIPHQLFSRSWEDELTHNEVAKAIIRTYNDYLVDIRQFVAVEYLFHKVVATLVRSTVCFYVQCLVIKADRVRMSSKSRRKKHGEAAFLHPGRVITRMTYDIQVFRDFFRGVAQQNTTLKRIVDNEFSVFTVLLECMTFAAGNGGTDSLADLILVIHKRTGANSDITRIFLSDIFVLMGKKDEHLLVENTVRRMREDLDIVTSEKREAFPGAEETTPESAHFRLDQMLQAVYEDRLLQEKLSLCGNLIREVRGRGDAGYRGDNQIMAATEERDESPVRSILNWQYRLEQLKSMFGDSLLR